MQLERSAQNAVPADRYQQQTENDIDMVPNDARNAKHDLCIFPLEDICAGGPVI
jgi:hypothetical protein